MSLRCVFPLVILYPGVPVSKLYCVFEWRETAINSVIWILNWILSNPSFLSWTHKEVTLVILHNSRRRCVIFVFYFIMETKFCWPGILHSLCSLETHILRSNSMVYKLLHQGVNFLYLQICYRNNEIRDEKNPFRLFVQILLLFNARAFIPYPHYPLKWNYSISQKYLIKIVMLKWTVINLSLVYLGGWSSLWALRDYSYIYPWTLKKLFHSWLFFF